MKKRDLFSAEVVLKSMGNIKGAKFAYFIAKNLKLIREEIETLKKLDAISDGFKMFEVKRIALCEKYSEKDDNKGPIIENQSYKISDKNRKKFNKELESLKEKYKESLDEKKKKDEELQEILDEESELKFYKIKVSDLPNDISANTLMILEELIEE